MYTLLPFRHVHALALAGLAIEHSVFLKVLAVFGHPVLLLRSLALSHGGGKHSGKGFIEYGKK